ncbi:hypothetical protein QET93_010110 [Akkermansia sp. N21116]|uniref:hypothetical protein n=1 Tax=Akkermansia sp. N21116 TaxID=3040764 RepID=UPI00244ED537|nr:hypothetical protein [Akkermansia sp. N21116]WPX39891.1 hypothetical protein QET93_010110 [Akkermansia sp. N21116]
MITTIILAVLALALTWFVGSFLIMPAVMVSTMVPVVWLSIVFLMVAEAVFFMLAGIYVSNRKRAENPVSMALLAAPMVYLLVSLGLVPLAFIMPGTTLLLSIHLVCLFFLIAVTLLLMRAFTRSAADAATRGVGRSRISSMAGELMDCAVNLKRAGTPDVSLLVGKLEKLSDQMKYAMESSGSPECNECDRDLDILIRDMHTIINVLAESPSRPDLSEETVGLSDLALRFERILLKRERIIKEKL